MPEHRPLSHEQNALCDRFRACLLGGAVGDALGEPIEFMNLAELRSRFGPHGLTDYAGPTGHISDDTQMTLFTAEGLIRANARFLSRGICHPPSVVHHAYLRWLTTQGEPPPRGRNLELTESGWLVHQAELHHRRAPGNTCLSALGSGSMGTLEERINDSKGCGGVMRVAPVGLVAHDPFGLGCEIAAITHGHPTGFLAAGAFALMIREIIHKRADVRTAAGVALTRLRQEPDAGEVVTALTAALELAKKPACAENVERIGGGWVAEEALAIGVYAAIMADSFRSGVLLTVNHSGDSDSTGSIAGNLLGARFGLAGLPEHWLARLEGRAVIEQVATDLNASTRFASDDGPEGNAMPEDFRHRYPPY